MPVPLHLIETLDQVHNLRERRGRERYRFLWSWSRAQAWRKVREVMMTAGIQGPQAMPKGLRHGFGMIAADSNIPITLVRQWMGHASLETTTAYFNALDPDENVYAETLWTMPVNASCENR